MRDYEAKWETFVARSNGIRAGDPSILCHNTDPDFTDSTLSLPSSLLFMYFYAIQDDTLAS
jgi:hypothetical protein